MKKRILIFLSILSLSVSLLIITSYSFGLFTDKVVSSDNVIKTGKLKVKLDYCDDYDCVLSNNMQDISGQQIYKNQLWQPNDAVTKYFKVTSTGSLDLDYNLRLISSTSLPLANKIDVYTKSGSGEVIDFNPQNSQDYVYHGSLSKVISNNITLYAGSLNESFSSEDFILVLYMQASVENDEMESEITFDLLLAASQITDEKVYIKNDEDLRDVVALVNSGRDSFNNKTVVLSNDIDLKGKQWIPIGSETYPFRGNFDGDNFTIYDLNIKQPDLANVGLFGKVVGSDSFIKNLNIDNAKVEGRVNVGSLLGYGENVIISNVSVDTFQITGKSSYSGGLVGSLDGSIYNSKVLNLSIDLKCLDEQGSEGHNIGGIVGYLKSPENLYENLEVYDLRIVGCQNVGGIVGQSEAGLTFNFCKVKKGYKGSVEAKTYVGSIVGRANGDISLVNCKNDNIKVNDKNSNNLDYDIGRENWNIKYKGDIKDKLDISF